MRLYVLMYENSRASIPKGCHPNAPHHLANPGAATVCRNLRSPHLSDSSEDALHKFLFYSIPLQEEYHSIGLWGATEAHSQ